MSALSVRLPNSLHERARELARREGISINQLVSSALAEKMSALLTEEHLEARARRGSRTRFLAALARVPASEPDAGDAFEGEPTRRSTQQTSSHRKELAKRRRARSPRS
ncbi:MAG: toxin-antitoxin system HicB family antitoxin [Acidimicrobiia bacterium]